MLKKQGIVSLFEVILLMTSIFAFSFIINTPMISAPLADGDIDKVQGGAQTSIQAPTNNIASISTAVKSTSSSYKALKDLTVTLDNGEKLAVANGNTFSLDKNILKYNGKDYNLKDTSPINELTNTGVLEKQAIPGTQVSTIFGNMDWGWGHIIQGATWAAGVAGAIQLLGPAIGMSDETTSALTVAAVSGIMAGKTAWALFGKHGAWSAGKVSGGFLGAKGTSFPLGATGIGIATGVIIFILMYKETEYRIVTFNCRPWQAPVAGDDCEKCNDDKYPCSEYRCKALGQSCELVNPGTEEERCINNHRGDVDPPILTPDADVLTVGHSYKNVKKLPPGPGFEIVRSDADDGCIKAFTPLNFGFTSDEPAQCKIDSESTDQVGKDAFEAMSYWVGGSNLYKYNHTEVFSLPGPASLEDANLTIANDGRWTFFVRCRDFNGNENEAEYAVRFCVDPSPDTTPPVVIATSVANGGYVPANTDKANVDFYINEPSTCKWDFRDQSYESMEYGMNCAGNVYEMNSMMLYTCKAELTAIQRDGTDYFVRCKDQPTKPENDRLAMGEGYEFNLKGSTDLKIRNLLPNGTVYGSTDPAKVELKAETLFGSEEGKAICFYSTVDNDGDYIKFLETEDIIHTQRQDLTSGTYTYYYKCVDSGGNVAKESTTFIVDIDTSAPVVARVYEDNGKLTVVTVKNSECSYSYDDCDFMFEEGVNMPSAGTKIHLADWDEEKTYYIKCRDEFKNEEADCSVVVRPSRKL